MIPSNRTATHPGIILLKEFLAPLELSQKALATHIGIPVQRVNEIVRGKRGISPDMHFNGVSSRIVASGG